MDKYTFLDVYCINLKRSPERYKKIKEEFLNNNINVKRYNAVDGKLFDTISTDSEQKLFKNCDFLNDPNANSIKACALSHLRLIRSFLNCHSEYYIISEDDYCFINNGSIEIIKTLIYLNDKDWDMVFFPYHPNSQVNDGIPKKIEFSKWLGAGTVLYILNKNTPHKINNIVNKYGFKRALDWFYLDNITNGLNIYIGPNIINLCETQSDIHN